MAETMLFTSNNTSIPADLFKSGGTPNGGVILIAHGTHGLLDPWGEQILGYGAALADVGFIALVPHYFDSTQTRPGVPAAEVIEPNRPTWQRALADAVAHATALPGADPSRIGLLGFSLGGHLCLQLRAMAKVLVAFFAPAFDLKTGSTNTLFAQVHHGKADEAVAFDVNLSADHCDAGRGRHRLRSP